MYTIVHMLEKKRTRFHSLNEWKEANDGLGCTDHECLRHCVVVVSKSMCVGSKVNEILATIRHDSTVLETTVETIQSKTCQWTPIRAVYALK